MYSVRENPPRHISDTLQIYDEFTQRLLYARGITTREEANFFLQKEWSVINPYQYTNMRKAADRLLKAIASNENIGIFSDYDCDGIPAAAALYSALSAFGHKNITYYVPDRNTEGFGLNEKGIEKMMSGGTSVVCILDCGTSNPNEVTKLENVSIDTIILDHHLPGTDLPNAFAVINPTLETGIEEPYPCAAGLVYIFIQALIQQAKDDTQIKIKPAVGWEKWQLDIIGLATLSDMVPLRGINRQLTHYGLQVFRKSPRPGIQALCKKLRINQPKAAQDDLSFLIIPRINSASRMGQAEIAFTLLTTNSVEEAMTLTEALTALNNKRKTAVASMVRTAHKQAENKNKEKGVWVFGNREWKPSLAGLVAQRMTELYNKTVFVWGQGGNSDKESVIKGSCRSVGHDLFDLMQKLPDLFIEAGGHQKAGGFTLSSGAEIRIEDDLNSIAPKKEMVSQKIEVDSECSINEVFSIIDLYEKFSPFGMENKSIHLAIPRCKIRKRFEFGKNKEHMRYVFTDETGYLDGVSFFNKGKNSVSPDSKDSYVVIGRLEFDNFRNKPQVHVITLI